MGSILEHQNLIKKTELLGQKEIPGIRFFDRIVGKFYTRKGRRIAINRKGMADQWAIYPLNGVLAHFEIEYKTGKARQTKEQKAWQKFIEKQGGVYFLVRDEFEAVKQIKEYIKEKRL